MLVMFENMLAHTPPSPVSDLGDYDEDGKVKRSAPEEQLSPNKAARLEIRLKTLVRLSWMTALWKSLMQKPLVLALKVVHLQQAGAICTHFNLRAIFNKFLRLVN